MVKVRIDDGGAIEGFVLLALAALAGFAVVVAIAVSMLIRREQTASAADLAALAAAQAGDCAVAARAAELNGARIDRCELTGAEARVIVAAPTGYSSALLAAGAPSELRAAARAALAVAADPVAELP